MTAWLVAAAVAGALALLAVAAVGGGMLYALLQGVLVPRGEESKLRSDVNSLRLEHDKLIEQVIKWNKKRGPLPDIGPGEISPPPVSNDGRDARLTAVRQRYALMRRRP